MTTVLLYVTFGLSLLANFLHFVAPLTDTIWDDKVEDVVDRVLEYLGQHETTTGEPKDTELVPV